jgi:hypothetical protein
MLLFEFDGALFQLEFREPEFAPSFQLPPKLTACLFSSLPRDSLLFCPCVNHPADLRNQYLSRLELMGSHALDTQQESHPKPQLSEPSVCGMDFRYLPGLACLIKQVCLPEQGSQDHIPHRPVLPRH